MKALTLSAFGSSDVLEYKEISDPALKDGEILVEMKTIGLNFADLMRRGGVYPMRGNAPYINGFEGAGIVKDCNDHPAFKPGDRVAFADVPFANAELVAVPFENAIPLPDEISFETAASVLLQGLTAHFLTADSHKIKPGETLLSIPVSKLPSGSYVVKVLVNNKMQTSQLNFPPINFTIWKKRTHRRRHRFLI